jgi:NCS1 family nucleobase:cation symporter-1
VKKKSSVQVAEQEAIFGVVPVLKKEKNYGFWDAFLVTSGFAIATWCYTQGAFMAQELSFKQLITSILGPNFVFITLTCLPVLFAIRYGIDIWVWLRAVFGKNGCKVICIIFILMQLPWWAVCADMFAGSIMKLTAGFGMIIPPEAKSAVALVCIAGGTLVALGGPTVIKWSSRLMVWALLAVGAFVVLLALSSVPLNEMIHYTPNANGAGASRETYMLMVEAGAGFAFSWALGVAVLPRLCKKERGGYWATTLSYGFVAPFFVLAGGVMAIAMFVKFGVYSEDPTELLARLGGPGLALLSLLLVAFANIGTQGSGTYIYTLVLKSSFPKLNYRIATAILMVYMGGLTLWGKVTEYFGAFISFSAFIIAPISGMVVVDFLFIRKQKISIHSLYEVDGHNAYRFHRGFNVAGIACMILGFASGILVYNPATGEVLNPIFYYTTASGLTFFVGGLSYFLLSLLPPIRRYMVKEPV